ncbi:glucuronyl esterase domain-containing protein [Rhodopirellula sp. JC639]|uniref:glucuronyl esterase domain-containing protein n=1 Tax=Stieleria mannarensis TaxID=2755585 RepID=UPI0015FF2EC4|nr:acetylxylan esterase [Rhodopirellula sp. JC639]
MFILTCAPSTGPAIGFEPNYDESKIPDYTLPDPLVSQDGSPITSAEQWHTSRRPELLGLFEKHVYGVAPKPCPIRHQIVSRKTVLDGLATRSEIDVFFGSGDDAPSMRMMTYVPNERSGPAPAFLGLNFQGNHGVDADPEIELNPGWFRVGRNGTTDGNKANEKSRGSTAKRWPVKMILDRGYGLATIYYGDIDPDFDDGFNNGIHGALGDQLTDVAPESRWGSIAAWAYGLSRALDCLESETELGIDASKVAVIGHSRLGKTSLWAGASDPRFAMVVSNNSGCGGAALSRRAIGETVGRINTVFPHWFCDQFNEYNENEAACPVDQHQLIALIAPRPVYVASASEDQWADPKGEFLAAAAADPVYRLLGTRGMGGDAPPTKMPAADQAINRGAIGYHLRTGKHDVTDYDWQQYLDMADRHLR